MAGSTRSAFLEAAHAVLLEAGMPLAVREIFVRAQRANLIQTSGATPEQTLKAKLSTDVLHKREASVFMRTAPNVFALRAWHDRYEEYVAPRFQKALLEEEIAVFDAAILPQFVPGPGLHCLSTDRSNDLLTSAYPMQRLKAEEDWSVIQLVSAFLVVREGRIATYKRTKRLPEARLHGVFSALFGGHLNPDDLPPLYSIFDPELASAFIQRELEEELRFSTPPALSMVGVLYDDRAEISKQHLGLLYEVRPATGAEVQIGERGFLQQLNFETVAEIQARIGDFENWSELVLRTHEIT